MEHLWSLAGATGGNRWQMRHPQKPLKQADPQPVATHGNRFAAHGKEAVDPLIIGPRPVLGGLQRTADGHGYPQRCATVARREGRQLRPPARSVGVDAGNAMETTG
jgi:hypothetical protein